jgi:hypothetical protein
VNLSALPESKYISFITQEKEREDIPDAGPAEGFPRHDRAKKASAGILTMRMVFHVPVELYPSRLRKKIAGRRSPE